MEKMFSALQASLNILSFKCAYWKLPSSQKTLTLGLGFLGLDVAEDVQVDGYQMVLVCTHIFSKNHLMANLSNIF